MVTAASSIASRLQSGYVRMLALSFSALFLELMMIRWVPAIVRLVAYYANLLLISSFLGLGIGALLAERRLRVYRWLPVIFLAYIGFLLLARQTLLPTSAMEFRFFSIGKQNYLALVLIFVLNAALFVPIGEQIGELFDKLPALRAYGWDLTGSLLGTGLFGFFAFYRFSPLLGIGAVMMLLVVLLPGRHRLLSAPFILAGLVLIYTQTDRAALWSPYYYVKVGNAATGAAPVTPPPPDLRTMQNPPLYFATVNQDFYQFHGTFDLRRYTTAYPAYAFIRDHQGFFHIPYYLQPTAERVAVIGAGGGPDVEAALLAGAKHVDAVEIDPVLVGLSRRYNASGVYDDPRVQLHITDARVFFKHAPHDYDLVAFAFLDSQGLSSALSNIRLDSYVYTVESMRAAFQLVRERGIMTISFATRQPWIAQRLTRMLHEGTGREPFVYASGTGLILAVAKTEGFAAPGNIASFARVRVQPGDLPPPTDDWPYLYLAYQTIPLDYLVVILTLVAVSVLTVLALKRTSLVSGDAHFFLMGIGFLLLQTKSVLDCALYFGATWLVTTIVVAGVLIMVLAANQVAMRLPGFSPWFYLPLMAALVLLYIVPRDVILNLPFTGRLLWTLLVVPIPIFFAGIIFSTTFRVALHTSTALAANLVGATIGGFLEYLNMAIGSHALLLIVMAAYLGSFLFARRFAFPAAAGAARVPA